MIRKLQEHTLSKILIWYSPLSQKVRLILLIAHCIDTILLIRVYRIVIEYIPQTLCETKECSVTLYLLHTTVMTTTCRLVE